MFRFRYHESSYFWEWIRKLKAGMNGKKRGKQITFERIFRVFYWKVFKKDFQMFQEFLCHFVSPREYFEFTPAASKIYVHLILR